jgi:hypothetical protein
MDPPDVMCGRLTLANRDVVADSPDRNGPPWRGTNQRNRDDQHALETTENQDPEVMARQILEGLPQVVAMLPPTEVQAVLQRMEGLV